MVCEFKFKLKELREAKGLQQKELANILNVAKSTVSAWEIGRNQPSYEMLMDIAQFFDVTIEYLFGMEDIHGAKTKAVHISDSFKNFNNSGTIKF